LKGGDVLDGEKIVWYTCEEHTEIVMEDFIDTYQAPPVMEPCDTQQAGAQCKWCGEKPKYQFEIHTQKQEIL
jgi:CxxH/CxxC protein (TIGR04129 family)